MNVEERQTTISHERASFRGSPPLARRDADVFLEDGREMLARLEAEIERHARDVRSGLAQQDACSIHAHPFDIAGRGLAVHVLEEAVEIRLAYARFGSQFVIRPASLRLRFDVGCKSRHRFALIERQLPGNRRVKQLQDDVEHVVADPKRVFRNSLFQQEPQLQELLAHANVRVHDARQRVEGLPDPESIFVAQPEPTRKLRRVDEDHPPDA